MTTGPRRIDHLALSVHGLEAVAAFHPGEHRTPRYGPGAGDPTAGTGHP